MRNVFILGLVAFLSACAPSVTTYIDIMRTNATRSLIRCPSAHTEPGLQGAYSLPRTVFDVDVNGDKDGEQIAVKRSIQADPRACLQYRFEPSALSDDVLEVHTDELGLLTTVASDTKDQSGNIAVKIAEAVFIGLTKGADLPSLADFPEGPIKGKVAFKASYDPLAVSETAPVRRALRKVGQGYCILVGEETALGAGPCDSASPRPIASSQIAAIEYAYRQPAVFYRRPVNMPVHVYRRDAKSWSALFIGNVPIFDQNELFEIKIDRYAFVQGKTTINFQNGSLTGLKLEKPSEALAIASIPVQIMRIAFAIPLAGLKQDTAVIKAEQDKFDAEKNLINSQAALVRLQLQQASGALLATPAN
jgi:hypothetical protein